MSGRPSQQLARRLTTFDAVVIGVFRGIMGFGSSSVVHTAKVLRLSEDLPIVIECVDQAANIEQACQHSTNSSTKDW